MRAIESFRTLNEPYLCLPLSPPSRSAPPPSPQRRREPFGDKAASDR